MKISLQGRLGSFHHIASRQVDESAEILQRETFRKVFADTQSGEADLGIVAIENSLFGSINEVYDSLLHSDLHIVGEVYLRIVHCLIGVEGAKLEQISDVYSMRPAIAQCTKWLDDNLPEADVHERHDTAEAAEYVKQLSDPTKAAVASIEAAKINDLAILERGIETNKANYTRFIVLSKKPNGIEKATKTSLIVNLNKSLKAGSLHNALGVFSSRDINLSKIESRPIPGTHWEYMFYIDIDGSPVEPRIAEALAELETNKHEVRLLGSYIAGKMPVIT
jgi:prephenate dehydratase